MRPLVVSESRIRCASCRVRLATLDDVLENDRFEVLCLGCSLFVRVVWSSVFRAVCLFPVECRINVAFRVLSLST